MAHLCASRAIKITRMARIRATREKDTPPKLVGITIARNVLSALADTRRVADGLNLSAVGGKECACRILSRGWES